MNKLWIFFIAISFNILETGYFGWHWSPSCPAEVVCDGICFLIVCIAFLVPSNAKVANFTSANKLNDAIALVRKEIARLDWPCEDANTCLQVLKNIEQQHH